MSDRKRARSLAAESLAKGEPLAWFERLYQEADAQGAVVPWADLRPNPHAFAWLDSIDGKRLFASASSGALAREPPAASTAAPAPLRALDVGCGFGDDAEELARRGFDVTAFDIAESAVARARARFPASRVGYVAANLLDPPANWLGSFDLVLEAYTLQVLPPAPRAIAARMLARLLAPRGVLLLVARGRDLDGDPRAMPWPLTRAEIEAIAENDAHLLSFEDFLDDEAPPVRRFRAVLQRAE
jgi:SAM-dependent methyltransferase